MALQPAAGVRDLHPTEVERHERICSRLAAVYRSWGYRRVAPPSVERADTLAAGGAIAEREIVRLASDSPLGLRPELTAPIARAAGSRLAGLPRPLRLWSEGTIFRTTTGDGGGQRLQEQLQSGVELLGDASAAADAELLRLLLAAAGSLGLSQGLRPQLLIGHHGVLSALLESLPQDCRAAARQALGSFDRLALTSLPLAEEQRHWLEQLQRLRGEPPAVLQRLRTWLGDHPLLTAWAATLATVAPAAERLGVSVQLDPSFQPHFALYDGLVLKLVCQGREAPVEIASGGRYDGLVRRFCDPAAIEAGHGVGVGFGFDVDALGDLPGIGAGEAKAGERQLVTYSRSEDLARALDQLEALHGQGIVAELLVQPLADANQAAQVAQERGCNAWTATPQGRDATASGTGTGIF